MLVRRRPGREGSASYAKEHGSRGLHVAYWLDEVNHCPSCSRSHWLVGRTSAECAFCGTALPLNPRARPADREE